ncbi:MAG TPA: hypothetical protein VK141_03070, partial [Nitrosomonas sp.]|nr:hypothetical protein [Nitrosomonas sp.]
KKENEIKDLQKYERKYSFGGEKIMDVEEKNLRNRTQTAINRCIQSIEMSNPQLGSHLAKHISRFNGTVVYYPPVDVIWETI